MTLGFSFQRASRLIYERARVDVVYEFRGIRFQRGAVASKRPVEIAAFFVKPDVKKHAGLE